MNHEIEAKIKVPGLAPVADRLKTLGAEFVHELRQIDTYFMDTHKRLHKNDCGLRIRRQTIGGTTTAVVTFKGARSNSRYKSRPEYETAVADPDTMQTIFQSLGYAKRITFEKKRGVWRLDDCLICLDELPRLGCFIEVEGPAEDAIFAVLEKLQLQDQPHISHGYASMMERELKTEDPHQTEIFLPS